MNQTPKVARYDFNPCDGYEQTCFGGMEKDEFGIYVKFEVIEQLEQDKKDLIEALKFYAKKENWRDLDDSGVKLFGPWKDHKTWTDCGYEYDWESLHDNGDLARETLTKMGVSL
jgi:hypothetical protein